MRDSERSDLGSKCLKYLKVGTLGMEEAHDLREPWRDDRPVYLLDFNLFQSLPSSLHDLEYFHTLSPSSLSRWCCVHHLMMSHLPSEIEALLREVQRGEGEQRYCHESQAPLPYAQPGIRPHYRFNAGQQNLGGSQHIPRSATNGQPLYESWNLQASSAPSSLRHMYQQEPQAGPTRSLSSA